MKNKKIVIPMMIGLLFIMIYLIFDVKSQNFPNDEALIKSMNEYFPKAHASKVLAAIPLDERHVFVPFVSSNDEYGISYWIKGMFQWKLVRISSKGEPRLWKLNAKEPSTHYLVWNIDPKEELSHVDYYLIRKRYYSSSQESNIYTPAIQMLSTVSLEEQPYGVNPLSEEWVHIMTENLQVANAKKPSSMFSGMMQTNYDMYIGWIPYNRQGKTSFPNHTVNGTSYSRGNIHLDFVRILNESELELP